MGDFWWHSLMIFVADLASMLWWMAGYKLIILLFAARDTIRLKCDTNATRLKRTTPRAA